MTFALVLAVVLTVVAALRRHGPFTFVGAGVAGFAIYSIPGLVGLQTPFVFDAPGLRHLVPVSPEAQSLLVVAWATVGLVLVLPGLKGGRRARGPQAAAPPDLARLRILTSAALVIGLAGFVALAVDLGPLFFLAAREEQAQGLLALLWRWSVPFGLVAATLAGRRRSQMVFVALLLVIFLRGDRTILAITGMALLVASFHGRRRIATLLRPRVVLGLALAAVAIVAGKPIYLAAKAGDPSILLGALAPNQVRLLLVGFEPFVVQSHAEIVTATGFTVPWPEFAASLLGNLLVLPSVFGVETNLYNRLFTESLSVELSYGIAGNYWAHGWSVGGLPMVAAFAALFAAALRGCDRLFAGSRAEGKVLAALLGGIIAVYTFRNGLDNLLSFVRQVAVSAVLILGVASVLGRLPRARPRGHREAPPARRPHAMPPAAPTPAAPTPAPA